MLLFQKLITLSFDLRLRRQEEWAVTGVKMHGYSSSFSCLSFKKPFLITSPIMMTMQTRDRYLRLRHREPAEHTVLLFCTRFSKRRTPPETKTGKCVQMLMLQAVSQREEEKVNRVARRRKQTCDEEKDVDCKLKSPSA